MIDPTARVHPTADLEPTVSVGPGTTIWNRAQIRRGASIGSDCVIGRDVFVDEGVTVGDHVKIQNAALVYVGVTVEDDVFIGPNAILTNDRYPRSVTANGRLARDGDWVVSPIRLHHGASIGAGAIVVAGNDVGHHATVGAGAVVTRSVAPHALVVGNPARRIGWVCRCGQRLHSPHGRPMANDERGSARCPACDARYVVDRNRCVEVASQPADAVRS